MIDSMLCSRRDDLTLASDYLRRSRAADGLNLAPSGHIIDRNDEFKTLKKSFTVNTIHYHHAGRTC